MGILFALLGSLVIGTANVLMKKSFKTFSPSAFFFIFSLICFILWGGLGFLFGFTPGNILYGAFVGFSTAFLAQAIYFHALSKGELSISVPILASYSVYTVLLSMIFNHEQINFLTGAFIFLSVLGTIIVALPEKINKEELEKLSPIFWAIGAAVAIGASDTISKRYINDTSVWNFFVYAAIAQLIVSFVYMKFQHQSFHQFSRMYKKPKDYTLLLWAALAIAVGTLLLFVSFSFTLASIASPLTSTYPVVTIILAHVFLKDKISIKNGIGIMFVVVGILIIGVIAK